MTELRWVWHDFKDGAPPVGSICINPDAGLYQKLQYRTYKEIDNYLLQSEWEDVSHAGTPD